MKHEFHASRGKADTAARAAFAMATMLLAFPISLAAQDSQPQPERVQAIIDVVRRSNAELDALRAEIEAARHRAEAAGVAPAPVLAAELEDVPGFDVASASLRLQVEQEFLTGGRRSAARSLADADIRLAEASLLAAEQRIAARVVGELALASASAATARRLAAEDSLLLGAEGSLRDRFGVGEARYVDVLRLRTERLRVQADRADAIADARAARASLLGLTADTAAIVPMLEAALAATQVSDADDAVLPVPSADSLLALSAEIRRAEANVQRASAAVELIRAEQRPRISGSLGAQRSVDEDGEGSLGPVVGASISLPFVTRGANDALENAAQREVEAAEAARASVVAQVRAGVAAGLARYEAAVERLAVYDAALLRGAREERESALAAYRVGDLSLVEFLDFERALARAEIDRMRARADVAEAYADLLAAIAGGS